MDEKIRSGDVVSVPVECVVIDDADGLTVEIEGGRRTFDPRDVRLVRHGTPSYRVGMRLVERCAGADPRVYEIVVFRGDRMILWSLDVHKDEPFVCAMKPEDAAQDFRIASDDAG